LNQAERVRVSFESYQASILSRPDGVVMRVTPDMHRPGAIFWADVHFLMIAVKHLDGVLKMLGSGAPLLDRGLKDKGVELRRLLEHWWSRREERAPGRAIARSTGNTRRLRRSSSSLARVAISELALIRCPLSS
jgi:hypothetical protein